MAKSKIVAVGVISENAGSLTSTEYKGFGGTLEFVSHKPLPRKVNDYLLNYDPENQKYYRFSATNFDYFGTDTDEFFLTDDASIWLETLQILPEPVNALTNKYFIDYWYSLPYSEFSAGQLNDRGNIWTTQSEVEMPDGSLYDSINPPVGLLHFFCEDEGQHPYWMDGTAGKWLKMAGTPFPAMYYRNANEPDIPVTLSSRFLLPEEPVFCVGLWRDEPPEEMTEVPHTRITFGSTVGINADEHDSSSYSSITENPTQWQLVVPYAGSIKLFMKSLATDYEWVELLPLQEGGLRGGSASLNRDKLDAAGFDMEQLWVGCFGPYICVSQDGFKSYIAVFDRSFSDSSEGEYPKWEPVLRSPLDITNVGGQWAVTWVPIYQTHGYITSNVHRLPYDIEASPAWTDETIEFAHTWTPAPSYAVDTDGNIYYDNASIALQLYTRRLEAEETFALTGGEHRGFDFISHIVPVRKTTGEPGVFSYYDNSTGEITRSVVGVWQTEVPWAETTASFWNFNEYGWAENISLAGSPVVPSDKGATAFPIILYRSPLLYRVDYWSPSEVVANSALDSGNDYRIVHLKSFSFDSVEGGATGGFSVDAMEKDENDDYSFWSYHDGFTYRHAGIMAGWLNHDGSITLPNEVVYDPGGVNPFTGDLIMSHYDVVNLPIVQGYATQPKTSISNGQVTTDFDLIDFLASVKEVQSDGTLPPFDGWYVYDAIVYLLEFLGLNSSYYTGPRYTWDGFQWNVSTGSLIEDTGLRLNKGKPYEPLWVAKEGTSIVDFINEMCLYDYGATIDFRNGFITKGCPYCGAHRIGDGVTSDVTDLSYYGYHLHPSDTGCLSLDNSRRSGGIDYHFITTELERYANGNVGYHPLEQEIVALNTENESVRDNYYNSVRVKGRKVVQPYKEIVKEYNDWGSILGYSFEGDNTTPLVTALGHKKQMVIEKEWINTNAIAYRVLVQNWYKYTTQSRKISITVPFNPMYQRGQVFAVYGEAAEALAVRNRCFRITDISQSYVADGGMTNTVLKGVDIRGV